MAHAPEDTVQLKGYLAEFETADSLLAAIEQTQAKGFRKYDAFSPYPLDQFVDAMHAHATPLPWIVLAGGTFGAISGWGLQYWANLSAYPMNIGGRPYNSWPSFIVVIFEMTILFAAFAAVFGMFALNGLPRPHHPVFNVDSFKRASSDRYFLYIEAEDPLFDPSTTPGFMEGLAPNEVVAVED